MLTTTLTCLHHNGGKMHWINSDNRFFIILNQCLYIFYVYINSYSCKISFQAWKGYIFLYPYSIPQIWHPLNDRHQQTSLLFIERIDTVWIPADKYIILYILVSILFIISILIFAVSWRLYLIDESCHGWQSNLSSFLAKYIMLTTEHSLLGPIYHAHTHTHTNRQCTIYTYSVYHMHTHTNIDIVSHTRRHTQRNTTHTHSQTHTDPCIVFIVIHFYPPTINPCAHTHTHTHEHTHTHTESNTYTD